MNLDWPNLVAGLVLGVCGTLPFWYAERRTRRRGVEAEWTAAARRIELLLHDRPTARELESVTSEYPLDDWRRTLGPADFELLDGLQNTLWTIEVLAAKHQKAAQYYYKARGVTPTFIDVQAWAFKMSYDAAKSAVADPEVPTALKEEIDQLQRDPEYREAEGRLLDTNLRLDVLLVAFINRARELRRNQFADVTRRERRADTRRHPIRTIWRSLCGVGRKLRDRRSTRQRA